MTNFYFTLVLLPKILPVSYLCALSMKAFAFYITLPLIYLISILPNWLFYRVSDLFFFLIYHVIGYRRKVVTENLRRSFPEKSEEEISRIRRKLYIYL